MAFLFYNSRLYTQRILVCLLGVILSDISNICWHWCLQDVLMLSEYFWTWTNFWRSSKILHQKRKFLYQFLTLPLQMFIHNIFSSENYHYLEFKMLINLLKTTSYLIEKAFWNSHTFCSTLSLHTPKKILKWSFSFDLCCLVMWKQVYNDDLNQLQALKIRKLRIVFEHQVSAFRI